MSESVRRDQVECLKQELEPGIPTILAGDFNSLRPNLESARRSHRAADKIVRAMIAVTPAFGEVPTKLKTMNIRSVVPQVEAMGYIDGDPLARPTVPARFPVLGLDYAFHTPDLAIDNPQVLNDFSMKRLSDHRPLLFDVHRA
jgi:endonuclease/exonuclease/phosphatase family metal-dependent hydrolase